MKQTKLLALLLSILTFAVPSLAQRGISLDIGHRHAGDSTRTTNFSFGLIHFTDTLRGMQLNGIANVANKTKGFQLAGVSNISISPLKGMQLSTVSNISRGIERGVQLSAMLNVSSGYMRGAQFATYNYADTLNGTQVGLINVALHHPKGWQIGLINYTRDTIAHKIGLINVNPKTTIDVMAFGGTSSKLNAAVRFRNRSTYNIIGVGTHYMGLDKKFSGALFYRIGQYFQLSPRFSLSGDVGYFHVETFESSSSDKPKRLFSLQARVNADYQFSDRLGAFVSAGWGNTRYYSHWRQYRSRMLVEAGLTFRRKNGMQRPNAARWKEKPAEQGDTLLAPGLGKKHPWWALAQVTGVNVGVHLFDRFVTNQDFAKTTLHTWGENFKNGFVWDNDQFSTNMFMHPYHGNLYFNSARSQGLSFWESAPYSMIGSLEWEFLGEIEPPAINDLIATTFGGICIGEVTNRISRIFLDDSKRGWGRFWREAAATVFNPMGELKRFATGDAWHVRSERTRYHDHRRIPLDFSISVGDRYLADNGALFRGEHNPYINLFLEYGDAVNEDGNNSPYDFFDAEVTFGLSKNQPIINRLHILGRLWSTPMISKRGVNGEFGIYQHFDYFDSKPVKDGSDLTPYRISEAAAFGPGIIMQLPEVGVITRLEQRLFITGILLGGTKSDYFNVIDRDYNMGSGFNIKSKTHLEMRNFGRFILNAQYYRIFTWKGYEQKDLSTIDPLHLNAQGDKGNASLFVINPTVEFDLKKNWSIVVSGSRFYRHTRYKFYDNVKAHTFELRLGITAHL